MHWRHILGGGRGGHPRALPLEHSSKPTRSSVWGCWSVRFCCTVCDPLSSMEAFHDPLKNFAKHFVSVSETRPCWKGAFLECLLTISSVSITHWFRTFTLWAALCSRDVAVSSTGMEGSSVVSRCPPGMMHGGAVCSSVLKAWEFLEQWWEAVAKPGHAYSLQQMDEKRWSLLFLAAYSWGPCPPVELLEWFLVVAKVARCRWACQWRSQYSSAHVDCRDESRAVASGRGQKLCTGMGQPAPAEGQRNLYSNLRRNWICPLGRHACKQEVIWEPEDPLTADYSCNQLLHLSKCHPLQHSSHPWGHHHSGGSGVTSQWHGDCALQVPGLGLCHFWVFRGCWCVEGCKHGCKNTDMEQMSLCFFKGLSLLWQCQGFSALWTLSLNSGCHFVRSLLSENDNVEAYLLQGSCSGSIQGYQWQNASHWCGGCSPTKMKKTCQSIPHALTE